jgi:hypothetical protein
MATAVLAPNDSRLEWMDDQYETGLQAITDLGFSPEDNGVYDLEEIKGKITPEVANFLHEGIKRGYEHTLVVAPFISHIGIYGTEDNPGLLRRFDAGQAEGDETDFAYFVGSNGRDPVERPLPSFRDTDPIHDNRQARPTIEWQAAVLLGEKDPVSTSAGRYYDEYRLHFKDGYRYFVRERLVNRSGGGLLRQPRPDRENLYASEPGLRYVGMTLQEQRKALRKEQQELAAEGIPLTSATHAHIFMLAAQRRITGEAFADAAAETSTRFPYYPIAWYEENKARANTTIPAMTASGNKLRMVHADVGIERIPEHQDPKAGVRRAVPIKPRTLGSMGPQKEMLTREREHARYDP